MGKKLLSFSKYIIFLGGGLLLVWWQLHSMKPEDASQFKQALHHADYLLIIPVVIMNLLSHLSRSMRWKLLMEPLGYHPKLKNVFAVTMVGYLANSAVNRLGEVLKCTFLSRYEHIKADKLIGTILVERTFDLLCYLAFIGITVLIQIDAIGGYVAETFKAIGRNGIPLWLKISMAALFILLIILLLLFKKYPENKAVRSVKVFLIDIGIGFTTIKNLKHKKMFLLHTLFIWSMYLLQIYLAFKAIHGTAFLGMKAACAVLTLSTLAMIITPGGIGSFPLLVAATLTTVYHVQPSQGNALGWLIWGVSTGIVIVAGVLSLVLLPYLNKNNHAVITGHQPEDLHSGGTGPANSGMEA